MYNVGGQPCCNKINKKCSYELEVEVEEIGRFPFGIPIKVVNKILGVLQSVSDCSYMFLCLSRLGVGEEIKAPQVNR